VTVAKNKLYLEQWRSEANELEKKAKDLYKKDSLITVYYHTELADGKWINMMNQTHIGYTYWQQPEKNSMPEVNSLTLTKESLFRRVC
jgi:N-acetyl-gamma-glutamylphosphate reductase